MTDSFSSHGLGPAGLAKLLQLGLERAATARIPPAASTKGDLFEAVLRLSPLSLHEDQTPGAQTDAAAAPVASMRQVLLARGTDLAMLERIKAWGRALASNRDADVLYAVGIAVYYAAIAAALVHHNRKITQHPDRELSDAFATLHGKAWMPSALRDLFALAASQCSGQ